jgi:hypothetical protein
MAVGNMNKFRICFLWRNEHFCPHSVVILCWQRRYDHSTILWKIPTYISEKVAVLTHHLQQLEHLGLPLAVLVAGVRVHDVVEGARGPGAHGASGPRSARVLRVDMEQLHQQRDAPNIWIDISSDSDRYIFIRNNRTQNTFAPLTENIQL